MELLAVVTSAGDWIDPTEHCSEEDNSGCADFVRTYLNRTREYAVVTSPYWGEKIRVQPVGAVGDCYEFGSSGVPEPGPLRHSAIATDKPEMFSQTDGFTPATESEAAIVRAGLIRLGPEKVRTSNGIRIRKTQLQGAAYFIAERHATSNKSQGIVFAIVQIEQGKFQTDPVERPARRERRYG